MSITPPTAAPAITAEGMPTPAAPPGAAPAVLDDEGCTVTYSMARYGSLLVGNDETDEGMDDKVDADGDLVTVLNVDVAVANAVVVVDTAESNTKSVDIYRTVAV